MHPLSQHVPAFESRQACPEILRDDLSAGCGSAMIALTIQQRGRGEEKKKMAIQWSRARGEASSGLYRRFIYFLILFTPQCVRCLAKEAHFIFEFSAFIVFTME